MNESRIFPLLYKVNRVHYYLAMLLLESIGYEIHYELKVFFFGIESNKNNLCRRLIFNSCLKTFCVIILFYETLWYNKKYFLKNSSKKQPPKEAL